MKLIDNVNNRLGDDLRKNIKKAVRLVLRPVHSLYMPMMP